MTELEVSLALSTRLGVPMMDGPTLNAGLVAL